MAADTFDLAGYRSRQAEEPDDVKYFHVHLGEGKDDDGNPVEEAVRIPPVRKWKQRALDAIAAGQITDAIRLVLSEDDFGLLEAYDWEAGEFVALFEALSQWSGFQMGQPSAPPPGRGLTRT